MSRIGGRWWYNFFGRSLVRRAFSFIVALLTRTPYIYASTSCDYCDAYDVTCVGTGVLQSPASKPEKSTRFPTNYSFWWTVSNATTHERLLCLIVDQSALYSWAPSPPPPARLCSGGPGGRRRRRDSSSAAQYPTSSFFAVFCGGCR